MMSAWALPLLWSRPPISLNAATRSSAASSCTQVRQPRRCCGIWTRYFFSAGSVARQRKSSCRQNLRSREHRRTNGRRERNRSLSRNSNGPSGRRNVVRNEYATARLAAMGVVLGPLICRKTMEASRLRQVAPPAPLQHIMQSSVQKARNGRHWCGRGTS